MKKKDSLSQRDKDDWKNFLEDTSPIPNKDQKQQIENNTTNIFKFDLHGYSLDEANKKVKEIIKLCSEKNYKEILLITGKGLHSNQNDVYKSSDLGKLKFSVPDFIQSDTEISHLVKFNSILLMKSLILIASLHFSFKKILILTS